jgi:hypothetical protein
MNTYAASLLTAIVTGAALVMPIASVSAAPATDYGSTVICRHRITQEGRFGWTEALLARIAVKPPTIYAKSGTQQVGWQFIVKRSLDTWNTPFVVTYRSHVQKRTATTSTPADFVAMRVGVNVPTDLEDQQDVGYKVTLKVFWYAADGSVASSAKSTLTEYRIRVEGEYGAEDEFCQGMARQWFN